ncbi:XRE family transcriptional regulator [Amycolatopsis cynarae]|uniref:XRE family transcriptional regulator n=1 Tax=Amycolatopsis cynarae TaxID=2995223 RepID=A0ABY7B1I1_9PSEU|nr:XRE family transcriptional regulator [Amycolatopsis sp. HUAS 11-8]WAL65553.1 XRE family transcriptional regulator [Amycolatopsis sp. HUAS 11-8]
MTDGEPAAVLARNIRARRIARHWSMDALAARAGLSKGVVVALEQGRGNPNLATLIRVGDALGVSLTALLEGTEAPSISVHDQGNLLWEGESGGTGRLLAGTDAPAPAELWRWRLQPGEEHRSEAHAPGTHELIHVLTGSLRLSVGQEEVTVPAGSTARMTADRPHGYANVGEEPVDYIGVVVVPVS